MENFAIYKFLFGYLKVGYEDDKLIYLSKMDKAENMGIKSEFTDEVFREISEYLDGDRKSFDFTYELRGTAFQKKVWSALLDIPYGQTASYKDVASLIGSPRAYRAVGMANNKNPIFIVVPCHRVIGSNGSLVGYAGGLSMKKKLLEIEKNAMSSLNR